MSTDPGPDSESGSPLRHTAILPVVYDELRSLAAARLSRLPPGQTLQPTALVHEVYLRLEKQRPEGWEGRRHYFFAAARAMRDILVEDARAKAALKRGGDARRMPLEDVAGVGSTQVLDALAVDEALDALEELDPVGCDVVMLRVFGGLTIDETAEVLESSPAQVKRKWHFTSAWLRTRMGPGAPE